MEYYCQKYVEPTPMYIQPSTRNITRKNEAEELDVYSQSETIPVFHRLPFLHDSPR